MVRIIMVSMNCSGWMLTTRIVPMTRRGQNRQPCLDWQFEEGIQDAVVMISGGKKISACQVQENNSIVYRPMETG